MTGELFPERIETPRLELEPRDHDHVDLAECYRICSADVDIEEATRYMPWNPHETINETAEFLDRGENHWDDRTRAAYVIRPRKGESGAGEIAGFAGLTCDWDRKTGNLGIWLRKRFWGRGYSGERAAALIELAFCRLDLEAISVTHHADNGNSRRAIGKYVEAHGGRCEGRLRNWVPYGEEVADEYRYTISREEYDASQ
jgi:ribosomal-protein-alanine N-acetyltransferase